MSYESPAEIIVAQRLKRLPTILNKLGRHPAMDITQETGHELPLAS